jgi:predicted permease
LASSNTQFILSLLIIIIGYSAKRLKLLSERDADGISRIIFNITLPALVMNTFGTIEITGTLVLIPFILILFSFLVAFLGIFVFKNETSEKKAALSMTSVGYNIGLFAFPLVEALWGKEGLKYFGILDMGNAVIIFGLCFFLASYHTSKGSKIDIKLMLKKMFRSVPLLAYILTLFMNLIGVSYPKIFLNLTDVLSRANMPLSLLVLGIYLSFRFERSYLKSMLKALILRYGTGLAVGTLLYFTLPFEPLFRITLLMGFLLPISMTNITYSVEFKLDKKLVGAMTNLTIIISFITIWVLGLLLK